MKNNSIKKSNMFFLFTILYFLILSVIMSVLFMFFNPLDIISMSFFMSYQEIIMMCVPVLFYFLITKDKFSDVIPLKKISLKNALYIIFFCILIQPFMSFLSFISSFVGNNDVETLIESLLKEPFLMSLFAIAVVPAVTEEFLMRGPVFYGYRNVNIFKAALVNGLFFGIMHLSIQQFLYASLLGFFFAYFVRYTGSIWSSILGHFVINGSQITISYLAYDPSTTIETVADPNYLLTSVMLLAISVPFTALALFIFSKFLKNNELPVKNTSENLEITQENPKIFDMPFLFIIIFYILGLLIYG